MKGLVSIGVVSSVSVVTSVSVTCTSSLTLTSSVGEEQAAMRTTEAMAIRVFIETSRCDGGVIPVEGPTGKQFLD